MSIFANFFHPPLSIRGLDPETVSYVTAVESADGQSLEPEIVIAINDFIKGCKNDDIWDAIKASCILAGARTLAGALVPLKGPSPTNVSNLFVSGDYNRASGLKGNGSTKYLNSNRNNNNDPQDSKHIAVYLSVTGIGNIFNSGPIGASGRSGLAHDGFVALNNSTTTLNNQTETVVGFCGLNRSASGSFVYRNNGSNTTVFVTSGTPNDGNILMYARPPAAVHFDGRLAFYSIGEALDLAKLDTRVTALISAFSNL
jgi:hypothetical protein